MAEPDSDQEESVGTGSNDLEVFLGKLIPSNDFHPQALVEPKSAYELLDEAPNGRKLMKYLFHSAKDDDCRSSELQRITSSIAEKWFEEERRSSTQLTPAALQLDAPVIFSWSKKASGTRSNATVDRKTNPAGETTNQILFKSISSRLSEIAKHREDMRGAAKEAHEAMDPESSLRKQQWAVSEFHVDPLQPFVARALPRESKKENTSKKKAKRRSILNFWGLNTESKRKEKLKVTKEDVVEKPQDNGPTAAEMSELVENPTEKRTQEVTPTLLDQPASQPSPASAMSMSSFVPLQPKKK